MKVNKSSIINVLKRSYFVSNSRTSRTAFNVEISTVQSCTCSDFAKNGHRVLCKHILFTVLHALNGKDLEPLRIRFIEKNDLRSLFDAAVKDIKHQSSYAKNQLLKERTSILFLLSTLVFLNHKFGKCPKKCKRLAKCTNSRCRKVINGGTECIVIDGALTVPFYANKAVAQKFYYYLDALCIANQPPWTNIRPLLE